MNEKKVCLESILKEYSNILVIDKKSILDTIEQIS